MESKLRKVARGTGDPSVDNTNLATILELIFWMDVRWKFVKFGA